MAELRGTWGDPAITGDPRIDDRDPLVRRVAEMLHSNESLHMHEYIPEVICPYCALRTSRVLRWAKEVAAGREPERDTPWGLIRTPSKEGSDG